MSGTPPAIQPTHTHTQDTDTPQTHTQTPTPQTDTNTYTTDTHTQTHEAGTKETTRVKRPREVVGGGIATSERGKCACV